MKKTKPVIVFSYVVIAAIPLIFLWSFWQFRFSSDPGGLRFNQHFIENLRRQGNAAKVSEKIRSAFSFYTFVWSEMLHRGKSNEFAFSDADRVFDYVFARTPGYALVYPTEMYYYFNFSIPGSNISGNFRLVELINGRLSLGYFDTQDGSQTNQKFFSADNGLKIKQLSDTLFRVNYKRKTVYFKLSGIWNDKPKNFKLSPSEEFVTKVLDESGTMFHLLFNEETDAFYYILDEERPSLESLVNITGKIYVGERTGFAYYLDADLKRKILFGVRSDNIRNNNYFDGPFDQVFPFLNLKDKIYKSYPYTQLSGVDLHGNVLKTEGMRVAITPYFKYRSTAQLKEISDECLTLGLNSSEFLSCLTYEPKRDFHRSSPLFEPDGTLKKPA